MNLLFITHKFYPDIGGIEINSEILARHFQELGACVKLLTWSEDPSDRSFPFEVNRNPKLSQIFQLHKWADVVYENNPSLKLSWPKLLTGKPNVVAIRTWISRMDGRMAFQDKLKIKWLSHANGVISVSQEVRLQTFPESVVIGNPFRSELFKIMPNIKRTKDFVFLGRLVSDKGADMAVKLIAGLSTLGKHHTLTVVGDGDQRVELERIAKELGVARSISFTGILRGDDLVKELNAHKFLIAPSRWKEPFGNIALEAMACGCIPIVSNGGGLVDAVGKAGIVFERNNQTDLLSKVNDLLDDEEKQELLTKEAAGHLNNHLPEVVARAYFKVIKDAFEN